jgi:hypothetical protein
MKYYIGEIETYIGESQVSSTIRFKTTGDPDDYLDNLASDFWGETDKPAEDGEMYDFGDKATCGGRWQRVNGRIYEYLHIITELRTEDKSHEST